MTWHSIRGHDAIAEQFRRALARGRLASTFLFVGPAGIGKRQFALKLAQGLLCERVPEAKLDPCEQCPACQQVAALTHPDVEIVSKPPDKNSIPIDLLIGDKEHRGQEGLLYNISRKPYSGRRKIAIIDDADSLYIGDLAAANALLKTLEEPPPRSILILVGTSLQRQLATIRSRCQVIRFSPLSDEDVAQILVEQNLCEPAAAARAARQGEGSVQAAAQWCDERLLEFRVAWLETLSQQEFNASAAAKVAGQFIDEAGKESAVKRRRLRLVISQAEGFYRAALLTMTTGQAANDEQLAAAVNKALRWLPGEEAVAACLDACLSAYAHVDANANQATLLEWLLDELAQAARGEASSAL